MFMAILFTVAKKAETIQTVLCAYTRTLFRIKTNEVLLHTTYNMDEPREQFAKRKESTFLSEVDF